MGDAIMKYSKITLALAAFAATACAIEVLPETPAENQPEVQLYPMTFTAGADDGSDSETKVTLEGKSVLWAAGDQIKVFDGTATPLSPFTVTSGEGTTSASFSGSVADPSKKTYYALYPYQETATFTSGEIEIGSTKYSSYLTVDLPEEQQAVDGSVDPKAFLALAVSDGNGDFSFKNLNSLVKFRLSESDITNLKSISISSNSLEAIAGNMKVAFNANGVPVQTYVSGQMDSYITLKAPTEGFKANTDYFIAIRSIGFASGLTITAKYEGGTCKHATSTKAPGTSLTRNSVLSLGTLPLAAGLPNDLYIAYLHGQDIDVAGTKFNKKDKSATLVTANEAGYNLSESVNDKTGLFFLDATNSESSFSFSSIITTNGALVSRYTDRPILIKPSTYFKITTGGLAFLNLDIDMTNINGAINAGYSILNSSATDLDYLLMDNCRITNISKPLLSTSTNSCGYAIKNIKILNSSFEVTGTTNIQLFNLYNCSVLSRMKEITFNNNIVYSAEKSVCQAFNWGQKTTQTEYNWNTAVSFCNNTFYNTPSGNGHFKFYQVASLKCEKNIYWAATDHDQASCMFILYSANQSGNNITVEDNIAYGLNKNWTMFHSNSTYKLSEGNVLTKLNSDPLQTADPKTGVFIPASAYAAYGAQRSGAQSLSARQTWSGVSEWN